MHLDTNRFFIVSGLLSFSLFALILAVIGWQFLVAQKPNAFALNKSDVISISLVPSLSNAQESIREPLMPQPDSKSAVEKIIPQKTEPKVEEVAISDLFSTVKTNNSPQKTKEDKKQLSELNALEEKVLTSKRDSKLFEKAKTLDLAKAGVKVVAAAESSGPVVNEYNAKIQGIIYTHFHPASGTEGFTARVRIVLNTDGKLASFRVISYSRSSVFNAEVDWLKERLTQVAFPSYPNGNEAIFEIILTAKE
ncbi:MAG: TonB C-terminal domain-containing protein [Sulfuricurvum sp.]|nr:TonB C-terminal domain-containing protein [Sulfuricurvum sp.]